LWDGHIGGDPASSDDREDGVARFKSIDALANKRRILRRQALTDYTAEDLHVVV